MGTSLCSPCPSQSEVDQLDFIRIGDKLIDRAKIDRAIDQILTLRSGGLSQQEVADKIGVDRTLVSRLEGVGEVRKGESIAVIGFPVENKDEAVGVAAEEAVDFAYVLTDQERWDLLNRSGAELFNELMRLMARIREFRVVVILGLNQPARFFAALLDREVTVLHLKQVPGSNGRFDPEELRRLIRSVKTSRPARVRS
ncbi:MAG: transcriptional regulator [Bacillota bacterium]